MKEITDPFNERELLVNDHVMNYKVEKEFKTDLEVLDRDYLQSQINTIMAKYLEKNIDNEAVEEVIGRLRQKNGES